MGTSKNKKIIITGISVLFLILIVMSVYVRTLPKDTYQPLPAAHIIPEKHDPSLTTVVKSLGKTEFSDTDIKDSFSENIINKETINFFKTLQSRFSTSTDFESHYNDVCNYIKSKNPDADKSEKLCGLYRTFTEYEVDLEKQLSLQGAPETAAEALDFLKKQQDIRRDAFGAEIADELYGAEVKSQEYSIRRSAIVKDNDLFGDVKMQMIKDLNQEMWGDEANLIEQSTILNEPFNNYQEKLAIYEKDLSAMTPGEKDDFTRKTRKEFFPDEVVEKFEQLDAEKELDSQKLAAYRERENEIKSNPDIPEKEREQAIRDLQFEIFGKEGSLAFRRIEAMRKAEEK